MKTLRLVLGDQLSRDLPSLVDLDPAKDLVLMAEVMSEVTYVKHHKRKIAYLFSAMRHFANSLGDDGIAVRYRRLDDPMIGAVVAAASTAAPLPLTFALMPAHKHLPFGTYKACTCAPMAGFDDPVPFGTGNST